MAKTKSKRIGKIKKNHSWITIIIFILIQIFVILFLLFFAEAFLRYIVKNKTDGSMSTVSYLAKVYENAKENDNLTSVYKMLDEDNTYIVKDERGSIIHRNGKNTVGDKRHEVVSSFVFNQNEENTGSDNNEKEDNDIDEEEYEINEVFDNIKVEYKSDTYVYEDRVFDYINVEDGEIMLDIAPIYRDIFTDPSFRMQLYNNKSGEDFRKKVDEKIKEREKNNNQTIKLDNGYTISLPYWISVKLNDGGEFIVKSSVDFEISDIAIFLLLIMFLSLLIFVVFLVMFISVIVGIINQRKTIKLLFTDIMTNGHNYYWFLFKGENLLKKRRNAKNLYAVVNIRFIKYRNYCMCHSVEQGEMLLKTIYGIIGKNTEKKELYAHMADSDFALLLKFSDEESLKNRVENLINTLKNADPEHSFNFQAGIAVMDVFRDAKGNIIRRKNVNFELLYNNACTAGETISDSDDSGIAFFDSKLIEDQRWIDRVTERQRYALENEEFVVYYQPKYDPATDKLKGAEALIRWKNEEMGFVPPGRFIPIFEKNGFITEIDHYMLHHVAKAQKEWLEKGYKCVPVSVNISRAHFIENDLAEQIRDIVDSYETPHEYIELELTESAFFDDKKALINTITKLRNYGFCVSMDDFGSGYSSLNSLKDMPLDVLKLDAEFFRGDFGEDRGEIVVSEAIKLAKSLNMRTVAEGIEVKEQVDFLAKQGCDMIQGYYYAKPMPGEEYEQKMK